jgi:hypothetical protein
MAKAVGSFECSGNFNRFSSIFVPQNRMYQENSSHFASTTEAKVLKPRLHIFE